MEAQSAANIAKRKRGEQITVTEGRNETEHEAKERNGNYFSAEFSVLKRCILLEYSSLDVSEF